MSPKAYLAILKEHHSLTHPQVNLTLLIFFYKFNSVFKMSDMHFYQFKKNEFNTLPIFLINCNFFRFLKNSLLHI